MIEIQLLRDKLESLRAKMWGSRDGIQELMDKNIIDLVALERDRQDEKWGHQDHPNYPREVYDSMARGVPKDLALAASLPTYPAEFTKEKCNEAAFAGDTSWALILLEEVHELIEADDDEFEQEAVQLIAVITLWMERRKR